MGEPTVWTGRVGSLEWEGACDMHLNRPPALNEVPRNTARATSQFLRHTRPESGPGLGRGGRFRRVPPSRPVPSLLPGCVCVRLWLRLVIRALQGLSRRWWCSRRFSCARLVSLPPRILIPPIISLWMVHFGNQKKSAIKFWRELWEVEWGEIARERERVREGKECIRWCGWVIRLYDEDFSLITREWT